MSLAGRLFAAGYDHAMGRTEDAGLRERRRRLLAGATGRVLEIGAGTGANLSLYPDSVTALVVSEPEEPMARRLEHNAERGGRPLHVLRARAEMLPFPDASFDVAVSTLVLCTVNDPAAALSELRRVLKPGSRLLFLEHVRSDRERLAQWQDRIHPLWLRVAYGCNCNRDTLAMIGDAGFETGAVERGSMPKALPFVRPLVTGSATR
jgi:ubiquinone/menaquinone biosynthesis C-methylase UbiE